MRNSHPAVCVGWYLHTDEQPSDHKLTITKGARSMAKKQMTEKERKVLPELITLLNKMPKEKQYYILGYMQAESDRTLQKKANAIS